MNEAAVGNASPLCRRPQRGTSSENFVVPPVNAFQQRDLFHTASMPRRLSSHPPSVYPGGVRSFPSVALLLPLTLAACGRDEVKAPADYALSGTISGDWGASPRLRLALIGGGVPIAATNRSDIAQHAVSTGVNTWQYGFDLPGVPNVVGVYQVVAYDDANNDATFNLGEPVARNRLWLVFSPKSGTYGPFNVPQDWPGGGTELLPEMTVSQGWNVYDRSQALGKGNPRAASKITGYDISR